MLSHDPLYEVGKVESTIGGGESLPRSWEECFSCQKAVLTQQRKLLVSAFQVVVVYLHPRTQKFLFKPRLRPQQANQEKLYLGVKGCGEVASRRVVAGKMAGSVCQGWGSWWGAGRLVERGEKGKLIAI